MKHILILSVLLFISLKIHAQDNSNWWNEMFSKTAKEKVKTEENLTTDARILNGEQYQGRIRHTYPNGDVYEGEFKENKKDGQGTAWYANGHIYEGAWKDGNREGQGIYTYPNGDVYVGEFKENKKDGQGTFKYSNGDVFEGAWKQDQIEGQGIFTLASGEVNVEAWKNGELLEFKRIENRASDRPIVPTESAIRVRIAESIPNISKIAVIGKQGELCDGNRDDGQSLAELVEGELIGVYGVVERKHLKDILDEQRLAMGGLVFDDSDFAQAGCLAGAQGTVLTSYGCVQGKVKIQVKLVDCTTSEVYWSATGLDVLEFELLDKLRIVLENR